jgi:hypothetical protein
LLTLLGKLYRLCMTVGESMQSSCSHSDTILADFALVLRM